MQLSLDLSASKWLLNEKTLQHSVDRTDAALQQSLRWLQAQPASRWLAREGYRAIERDYKANVWLQNQIGLGWGRILQNVSTCLHRAVDRLPNHMVDLRPLKQSTRQTAMLASRSAKKLDTSKTTRKVVGSLTFAGVYFPFFWLLLGPVLGLAHLAKTYLAVSWLRRGAVMVPASKQLAQSLTPEQKSQLKNRLKKVLKTAARSTRFKPASVTRLPVMKRTV